MFQLVNLRSLRAVAWTLVMTSVSVVIPAAAKAQYTWVNSNNQNGNWTATARWTGGAAGTFPNAVDATATFNPPLSTAPSGNFSVQIGTAAGTVVTIGGVTVNNYVGVNDDANLRIGPNGNGSIVFQSSTNTAFYTENAAPTIENTAAGITSIFAPVTFASNTTITQNHAVNNNNGTQFTSGANSPGGTTAAPGIVLTKEGAGNVEFNVPPSGPGTGFQGSVVVNAGAVRETADVFANASGVTVNGGGQFQLGSSTLTSWSLAPGASLVLNGAGKASGVNPEGALRFQNNAASAAFINPVTLASDSTVYVAANLAPTPPNPVTFGKLSLPNQVSGDGGLTKSGPGILELTQNNTYAGNTVVNTGTLVVNNTTGSATGNGSVTVNVGAVLAGSGLIAGSVNIADGTLAPGNSPGTITLGSTTLSPLSTLAYQLDTPGVVGGGVNDLTEVNGSLTLAGTLAISPLAGFGIGQYRLFDYSGELTNNGLSITGLPSGFAAALDFSIPHQINLGITAVPEPSTWALLFAGSLGLVAAARQSRSKRGAN